MAFRIMARYIEFPHSTFPTLIDDAAMTVKNNYTSVGGDNHILIIDKNGKICSYYMQFESDLLLQDLEKNMIALLDNGGIGNHNICVSENSRWNTEYANRCVGSGTVMFCGFVQSVSGNRVKVRRVPDSESDYLGYTYYKENPNLDIEYRDRGETQAHQAVGTWLADPGRTYTFSVNGLHYNGQGGKSPAVLKKGDFIAVRYNADDTDNPVISA